GPDVHEAVVHQRHRDSGCTRTGDFADGAAVGERPRRVADVVKRTVVLNAEGGAGEVIDPAAGIDHDSARPGPAGLASVGQGPFGKGLGGSAADVQLAGSAHFDGPRAGEAAVGPAEGIGHHQSTAAAQVADLEVEVLRRHAAGHEDAAAHQPDVAAEGRTVVQVVGRG